MRKAIAAALLQSYGMPSVSEPAEFFVVGGPVPPDRTCYVERAVDRQLESAIRARRLACVLGPRASGKSSLLARAARKLRAAGVLVAALDLEQCAQQAAETGDDGLRGIAARIAAQLGLGVDVDAWWKTATADLGENRFVEFFWEIVLTNTTAPVAVLIDEVDTALELQFGAELLAAIGGCYSRRSREPDFARLTFVLAGCLSRARLAAEGGVGDLADAEIVEPQDFSAPDAYRLAVAFGGAPDLAQALMDRIHVWTSGHPYLTQKVARGVARKGGRLEDVERVVREQLLAPGVADRDQVLGELRAMLTDGSRASRRAVKILEKLASGGKVSQPTDPAVADRLWSSGAVRADRSRKLELRNRIIKELVAARWLGQVHRGRRVALAAAALLVVVAAGGYWYTQYLPVGDVEMLTSSTADAVAAEEAYRRLRALPGFAERADELWRAALARHSRAATTLAEAAAVDTRLRALPGQDEAADRLLGEFWLRRARQAMHAEQRDAALLMVQRAASLPVADPAVVGHLEQLVGQDYLHLERTLRLRSAPESWHMAFERSTLLSIDAEHRAARTPYGAAARGTAVDAEPVELTALQHVALTRELPLDGDGTAGEFTLSLAVQHPSGEELLVTLTAPSGAAATVSVPSGDGALAEAFQFQAAQGTPLAQLADEGRRGTWRLTVVDRLAGNSGLLAGWGLTLGEDVVRDDPTEPLTIPDPTRVAAVGVSAVAERAVVWPTTPGAIGTLALWDLATGRLEHDFTLPAPATHVAINATGTRLLAATAAELVLWNVADGARVARVITQTEFVLPPVFSPDGGYVAIAERVDEAPPLYSVLRAGDASLVSSIEGAPDVQRWQLGPGARYVLVLGPANVVHVLETRRGTEIERLPHDRPVARVLPTADGEVLVTVDEAGVIESWAIADRGAARARPLGRATDVRSVSLSGDGARLAFAGDDGAVAVVDVATGVSLYRLRPSQTAPVLATELSPDGLRLVTQSDTLLRLWSLPASPAAPAAAPDDAAVTALAVDHATDLVAIGLRSGQVQIGAAAAIGAPQSSLAFFGHRGAVTAIALNASQGLAATGGSDGIVRVWNAATAVPTGVVMQPADAAILGVALSVDGRLVASAADRVARVASVADGVVSEEVPLPGAVRALVFAPDASSIAVGDERGTVTIVTLTAARAPLVVELGGAATALAFAPNGSTLAIGDAGGAVRLVRVAGREDLGVRRDFSQPVRGLGFSPDGGVLFVATDAWVHALSAATESLEPVQSQLVMQPAHAAMAPLSATVLRVAGLGPAGEVAIAALDLAAAPSGTAAGAALGARDWSAALALRLDDNGDPVAFDP
jgi:WD40 repeat protein